MAHLSYPICFHWYELRLVNFIFPLYTVFNTRFTFTFQKYMRKVDEHVEPA